jgi:hypothetical protein
VVPCSVGAYAPHRRKLEPTQVLKNSPLIVKKIAQSKPRPIFCQNYYITYTSVKSNPIIWATYVIFKNHHPKVNNCPTGEKLPNLVTLFGRHTWMIDIFFGFWVANANFSNYRRLFWLDSISRPKAKNDTTGPRNQGTCTHNYFTMGSRFFSKATFPSPDFM